MIDAKISVFQFPEGDSKNRVSVSGKVNADEEVQYTQEYVSLLKRLATRALGPRCRESSEFGFTSSPEDSA